MSSSPITKFNHFSRLFSSKSSISPRSALLSSTPHLDSCTPGLLLLPDELVRKVETPFSHRSPSHCSTPALFLKARSNYRACSRKSARSVDSKCNAKFHTHLQKKILPKASRNRRFGISDNFESEREEESKAIKKRRRCNVFSASVVPFSPPRNKSSQISRLSGLILSPTSVSWTAQSPFQSNYSKSSKASSPFFYYPLEQPPQEPLNRLRVDSIEQCPPEKLYYWNEYEDEIEIQESIGTGGFGRVFRGMYRGEQVAIKELQRPYKSRQIFVETFQGEILALRLRHPNVVRTLVIIQTASPDDAKEHSTCYILMEDGGNFNLSQLINNMEEVIDRSRRNKFCGDILNGLNYLHEQNLAHLDIKPSNVIVTSQDTCKICDFGTCIPVKISTTNDPESTSNATSSLDSAIGSSLFSAKMSSSSAKSSSNLLGTFVYRAPELLKGSLPTVKADIFSFGITAWQMWSRVSPYLGQHCHTAVYGVVALGLRPSISDYSESISEEKDYRFFHLLTTCWQGDPTQRPTAKQALMMINEMS